MGFYIKINVLSQKKVEFRVSKFRFIFLKVILFLVVTLFPYFNYLFELIFALLAFRDKGIRVLVGLLLRSKINWHVQTFPMVSKSIFLHWKTCFFQFIDKFLKFEEIECLSYSSC